ncbi:MAG: POTRA domain-containing protein [Terriglobales bacterium]
MTRVIAAVFACFFFPTFLWADCAPDYRSNKNSGLFIADFVINGTVRISSTELTTIRSKLIGACIDEDSDETEELVRSSFQDRGYFAAAVKSLDTKTVDPLAQPKHVTVEADIVEGPQYNLAEIRFVGNHAFGTAKLRTAFAFKKGDLFTRDKVASGLERLRRLYAPLGFRDLIFIPDTESLADATIVLTVTFREGPQYHMGKLRVFANKEVADRLQGEWRLRKGAVFDLSYPDKYIDANRSLLPAGFSRSDLRLARNCPDALIEVDLIVDQTDPSLGSLPADVKCEKSNGGTE